MNLQETITLINSYKRIEDSVDLFLSRNDIPAFGSNSEYELFKGNILRDFPSAQEVIVAGSGNWGYSFNPKNNFREFNLKSDIDVVIIDEENFTRLWGVIREFHRNHFYKFSKEDKLNIRRNGENIYAGFVTSKWLPDGHKERIIYNELSNKYSDKLVLYRTVNIMFFRNRTEVTDYYKRSFRISIYNFNHK